MDTQRSDGTHLSTATEVRPAEPQIVRRAIHLCLRAEPHAEAVPCSGHPDKAQRQLDPGR